MNFPGYFRDHILPEKLHVLSVSFLIDKMQKNFGGTAGNIAYNLALLGEKPAILASAGNDFGEYEEWIRSRRYCSARIYPRSGDAKASHYEVDKVNLSYVQRVKNMPTAAAYIITDQSDCQIVGFYPGSMQEKLKIKDKKLKTQIKNIKIAIVAPGNLDDMRKLPAVYKDLSIPYIYDPGQNITALSGADLRAGITGAKVFISNDYELALVLKKTEWKKQDLLKRVEILVTTLGEKGSVIEFGKKGSSASCDRKPSFHILIPPAKPKNVCDPTGAGDAYRAGFIKGLLMGLPYDKMGKLAGLVSVYTVEKYGTQTHQFMWRGLMKRYRENFREKLL